MAHIARELAATSMQLQDTYGLMRRLEQELVEARAAHAKAIQDQERAWEQEREGLKSQLVLMQLLMHTTLPKAEAPKNDDGEEYTV